jgi:alginate O-acetyltransferase complex protein AlgI
MGGSRRGDMRTYTNLLTVFVLCGFWHGASWTFLVWGLWHGLFLIMERTVFGRILRQSWGSIQHSYTILVVVVGWVVFRADDLSIVLSFFKNMLGAGQTVSAAYPMELFLNMEAILVMSIGILCSTKACLGFGFARYYLPEQVGTADLGHEGTVKQIAVYAGSIALLGLCLMSLASGTHNPFIYFRF